MFLPGFPSHSALAHSGASGAVPHLQLSRRDDLTGLASTGSRGRDPSSRWGHTVSQSRPCVTSLRPVRQSRRRKSEAPRQARRKAAGALSVHRGELCTQGHF